MSGLASQVRFSRLGQARGASPGSLSDGGGEGRESEDDGDGPLGEHHGARGFDHPPDYHSDDAFCEEAGICEGDGF